MKQRTTRHLDEKSLDFHAEIDAIASMTFAEVQAGLQQFGVEPVNGLPLQFQRLIGNEQSAMPAGGNKSRAFSFDLSLGLLLGQVREKLVQSPALILLSFAVAALTLLITVSMFSNKGHEANIPALPKPGPTITHPSPTLEHAISIPADPQIKVAPTPQEQANVESSKEAQATILPPSMEAQMSSASFPKMEESGATERNSREAQNGVVAPSMVEQTTNSLPKVSSETEAHSQPPQTEIPLGVGEGATRTWVSGVGNDLNPCSRTAPCKTFAGAIQHTAVGGEINVLDPGNFGSIVVTKSISIDGGGIPNVSSSGIIVRVQDSGPGPVRISNLTIKSSEQDSEFGISYIKAKSLWVENCLIEDFSKAGINVSMKAVDKGHLVVRNTTIKNSLTGARLNVEGGNFEALFEHCVLRDQDIGIDARGGSVLVVNSVVTNNATAGVRVTGRFTTVVDNCLVSNNGNGILVAAPMATVDIRNSRVLRNTTGLSNSFGGTLKNSNNKIFDNGTNLRGS